MTSQRSKRRGFLSLVFIIKSISKKLLIKILKCNNQLQVNCETAVEFLKLCQNFELTQTFARVDKTKSKKWNVVAEEHCQQTK